LPSARRCRPSRSKRTKTTLSRGLARPERAQLTKRSERTSWGSGSIDAKTTRPDRRSPAAAARDTGGPVEVQCRPVRLARCAIIRGDVLSQEGLMPNTPCTREQSTFFPSSVTEAKREQQRVPRRPWSRITLGFWLDGILFGTAGCILGASLSYHHPVARVVSEVWWSIYFGCFGASLGVLPGLFLKRTSARDAAGKPPTEPDSRRQACPKGPEDYADIAALFKTVGTRGDPACHSESGPSGHPAAPVGSSR
jgi:hypothetical protein